ncbi:MAG: hypothetical protein G01um101438_346 [Parcubacteria group bacterium Gr01-1014_38]|nr:MAG: hypothetical protein G01um101438_346 [Parcubacteria group bacterium Gr01-1014_38]
MRDEIIEKLNKRLAEGINRESDVVYLFVEIRKLFEHDDLPQYPQLRFYGDWVVHTKLSRIRRDGALAEYLGRINDAVDIKRQGGEEQNVTTQITNAMSLDRLREEMVTFFQERSLDSRLLEVGQWRNFIKWLISILIDTPLVASNHPDFNLIKEFSFGPSKDETSVASYKIVCADGTTVTGQVFVN